jgi:hypothetical protein
MLLLLVSVFLVVVSIIIISLTCGCHLFDWTISKGVSVIKTTRSLCNLLLRIIFLIMLFSIVGFILFYVFLLCVEKYNHAYSCPYCTCIDQNLMDEIFEL